MATQYVDIPSGGGGGVTTLNGLTGALTLIAGSGINITTAGSNITIANTGGAVTSTPNTFAGFDSTGALESIPNWSFDNTSNGAQVNLTYDPTIGNTTINLFQAHFQPSGDSGADFTAYNFASYYDDTNTGFAADNFTNVVISQRHEGSGELNFMRNLLLDQVVDTASGVVDQLNSFDFISGINAGATIVNGRGGFIQMNNQGAITGDYDLLDLNINTNDISGNLTGLNVNHQTGAGHDQNLISIGGNGATGNNFFGINAVNNGAVAGTIFAFNFNNNNTIGNQYQGITTNNNNTGVVTNGYTGLGLYNNANIGQDYNGANIGNNDGANITGGYTGLNVYNSHGTIGGSFTPAIFSNNGNIAGDYNGFQVDNNANVAGFMSLMNLSTNGTHTKDMTGLNINMNGAALADVNGININMNGLTSPRQKTGMNINAGSLNVNALYDTQLYGQPGGEFNLNVLEGEFHVASGFPITDGSFGFGNNLGITVLIEDDIGIDSTGIDLGFSVNGLVDQIAVTSGKTAPTINYMLAGSGIAPESTGGTVTNLSLFRALGLLPEGGTLNITNLYGFKADAFLDAAGATNTWGVYVGATTADNWFAKNVVIGGSTGKPTGAFALDVSGDATISGSLSVGTGASGTFTTVDLKTVTVTNGIITSIV